MNRIYVESEAIESVGHEQGSQTLEIEFKNKSIWQYHPVTGDIFTEFMNSESKGKYFYAHIKGRYTEAPVFTKEKPVNREGMTIRISWNEDKRKELGIAVDRETVERALRSLLGQSYTDLTITIR